MSMLSDDLAAMFADTSLSVSVSYGTSPLQTTRGFLSTEDVPEPDGAGGVVIVGRRVLTIQDGSLAGLASNDVVTVDDVAYTLHGSPRSAGRGKAKLVLAEGT